MERIWLVMVEIVAETDSSSEPKAGFMNITTWADSRRVASSKIERYLNSIGWQLVQVERADVIDEDFRCGDDVADMIERTRNNMNAIILGTFHTYKTN